MVKLNMKTLGVAILLSMISSSKGSDTESTPTRDCIERSDGRGLKYRGTTSTTRSGLKCQNWKDTFPWYQRVGFEGMAEYNGLGDHNYCRTTAKGKDWGMMAPWCYNGDRRLKPDIMWEYCDIPYCENPENSAFNLTGSAELKYTLRRLTVIKSDPDAPSTTADPSRPMTEVERDRSWAPRVSYKLDRARDTKSSLHTFRPTWWRSDAPASTEPPEVDIVWWREKSTMTAGLRSCLMTYHMINLIMTALVNVFMIYIIITRINLRQRPCIIPILAASVVALLNVVTNYGFFIGLYMGDWWIRTFANGLCGYTEVMLEKVTLIEILCYSIVTYEATLAIQFPCTHQRSSKKTFTAITVATIAALILIFSTIYFYYNWVDTPDLFEEFISSYGEEEGSYRYNRLVAVPKSRETYLWYNYWKRCQRLRMPKTWDSYLLLYSAFIPCLIGVGTMIYSLIQTHRPGLQRRNFIDAVSGKHNFTTSDLDELKGAAKAVALTLMLSCIIPLIDYTQKTVSANVPSYYSTMRGIFGIVQWQWYEEILRRMAAFTSWVPALASLFLNPILSQARSGDARDFATPQFERWLNIRYSGLKKMTRRALTGMFKGKKPNAVSPSSSKEVYKV